MSEKGMSNVDNHANVGNQTIINIQNMSGSIAIPNGQTAEQKSKMAFYDQMQKLYVAVCALSDSLEKGFDGGKENKVRDFSSAIAQVLAAGKTNPNPTEEVSVIISLATDWVTKTSQSSAEIETSGDDLGVLFLKISQAVSSYAAVHGLAKGDVSEDAYVAYRRAAYNWYKELKTLLYDKTPREFYSFYVCNDLKHGDKIVGGITAGRLCAISRFIIISGTGGLGKSMMLRHLLLNALDNFDSFKLLPIFVPLKNYGETEGSLFDFVLSTVHHLDNSLTEVQLSSALKSGSCLLLFDGMDEVKSAVSSRFAQELDNLASGYPNNCFVLSSRPSPRFVALSSFCELELQPFSKIQALKMIDNFEFSTEEQRIKDNFRNQLDRDLWWSHKEFAENPLLLTIMLMTFEEYAEVPSKIHKFYEKAFETLAKRHDDTKLLEREFKTGLSKDEIADCLARICFLSYKDEKYELTENEFMQYFDRCQKNASSTVSSADFLHDLFNNLCLLRSEGGKYHFVHRSFQEYFCALNIRRGFEKVSTDKKTSMAAGLISFFDRRRDGLDDKVLEMLYDMVPEKVEEFVLIPKLEQIFGIEDLNINGGYWIILQRVFPSLKCWYEYHECIEHDDDTEEEIDESYYDFSLGNDGYFESKVLNFIAFKLLNLYDDNDLDDTYYDDDEIMAKVPLIVEEIKCIITVERDSRKCIEQDDSDYLVWEYSTFSEILKNRWGWPSEYEEAGEHEYWFSLEAVRDNPEKHPALRKVIESEAFHLRKVCTALLDYLKKLKSKQRATDDEWTEDFIR